MFKYMLIALVIIVGAFIFFHPKGLLHRLNLSKPSKNNTEASNNGGGGGNNNSASSAQTSYGVQFVFGQSPIFDPALKNTLHVAATTLWIYYPSTGGSQTWVNNQKQFVESTQKQTGISDIRLHIMPNDKSEGIFHLPAEMGRYESTLTALAQTLAADNVRYYSIGNEFSHSKFSGTTDDYVTLLRESGKAIKSGNPKALILESGLAGQTYSAPIAQSMIDSGNPTGALSFVQEFLKNFSSYPIPQTVVEMKTDLATPLSQDMIDWHQSTFTKFCPYYDVLQLHDYQGWTTMETVFDWIKKEMEKNSCHKPIEFWEMGYGLASGKTLDQQDQAQTVVKTLTIATAQGAKLINYFPFKETTPPFYGLATGVSSSYQMLPAGTAFGVTTGKLSGATAAVKLDLGNPNVWAYKFTNNGKDTYVLWTGSGSASVSLPVNGTVTVTDITGQTSSANAKNLILTDSPIFTE